VSFVPIKTPDRDFAGKPANGEIGSDGTFKLSTYRTHAGAVIGKHTVTFVPPPGANIDETQHKEDTPLPPNPLEGLVPAQKEVE